MSKDDKVRISIETPSSKQVENAQYVPLNGLAQIYDGSCDYLYANDVLDYASKRDELLSMLISKVRIGGHLILYGNDYYEFCRGVTMGEIPLDDFNNKLFNGKQSIDYLDNIGRKLEHFGLRIKEQRLQNLQYSLIAERPNAS